MGMNFKIRYLLFCFLTLGTSAVCQNNGAIQPGIKGGINYSTLNLDDVKDEKSRTGYHFGVFITLNILDRFAIQPELLYTIKGTEAEYDNLLMNGSASINLDYVELPVLAVLRLNKFINVHAGPYFSVLVNAKASNESGTDLFDFEEEVDRENFQPTDWGLSGGVGIDLGNIHVGGRYSRGLDKIEKDKLFNGTSYHFSDATNSVFQIYAGLHF
jgi:hypothetical protein